MSDRANPEDTAGDEAVEARPLAFGAGDFVGALGDRLKRSFERRGPEGAMEALVVGIYGAWGSGKTTVLRALEERFTPRADPAPSLTLPVLFNAWRYEKEEHLIVPLLKTAETVVIRWHEENASRSEKSWVWLRERGKLLGDAALALAYGFKGTFTLPFGAEAGLDLSKVLDEDRRRAEARAAAANTTIQKLASTYYDFHGAMRQLTGRAERDAQPLNLLFLIDDLDRCLPEKAVEMLEAIKLFLEVEGCAFVVAVDDEVVTRGIAHRYRDYNVATHAPYDSVAYSLRPERFREFQELRGPLPQQPITGTEYLEKIIHLPFRIPPPTASSVREFLVEKYPELFDAREASPPRGHTKGESKKSGPHRLKEDRHDPEPGDAPDRVGDRDAEARRRKELLELFLRCVPPVPRKLIRAAELFAMLRDVAHARGWRDLDEPTLARLVFLQLFAPALFRFGRSQPAFLATLEKWAESPLWRTQDHVEEQIKARIEAAKTVEDEKERLAKLHPLEQRERPLLLLLRDALRNRSGFDPRNLVEGRASAERLARYYHLLDAERPAAVAATGGIAVSGEVALPTAAPVDPEAFLAQLLSGDPLAWRNALEQEADRLGGRVLDDASFRALTDRVGRRPEVVTVPWLETLEPHLTADQLAELYRVSKLLPRLALAAKGEPS